MLLGLPAYIHLYIDVCGRQAFVVITNHKIYLSCQVGFDIAFQFDDLDEVYGLFVIFDIVTPGGFIFFYQLAFFLYGAIQGEKGAFGKSKSRGDGSIAAGILGVKMIIPTDGGGHMYLIGHGGNLLCGISPVDLFTGLGHGEGGGQDG
jgi:hypothetical protein